VGKAIVERQPHAADAGEQLDPRQEKPHQHAETTPSETAGYEVKSKKARHEHH
jgi:hypothetical protein